MDSGMIPYKRNLFRDGNPRTFANIAFYDSQVFGVIFESKSGDNIQSLFEKEEMAYHCYRHFKKSIL